MGIALDGDADRLIMVDAEGMIYDGDQLLLAVVRSRLRKGPVAGVVGTLMTNLAFEHALAELGVPFARANVGDRYVMEMLREKGWLFGGENSGHILCLDKHTTGDGIVSALQVLTAIRQNGGEPGKLLGELALYPQLLINVPLVKGFPWKDHPMINTSRAEVETELKFTRGGGGDNAGLLAGVSEPGNGADNFHGYEISLAADGRKVVLGKHKNNFTPLY
jgi:phosphoglucosamine mutase